jgi:uncharacterized protein
LNIIKETKVISGIPVLEIYNDDIAGKKPLILLLHGFTQKKESMKEFAAGFAEAGFYTCSFDAFLHGDLKPEKIRITGDYLKLAPGLIFRIYSETQKSIDMLLEHYRNNSRADADRTGLTGVSMGGNIIFKYLAGSYRANIKAAVPVISSPSWGSAFKSLWAGFGKPDYFSGEDLAYLESIEPANSIGKIKDIPLLMLNAADDAVININDARKCFGILSESYADRSMLKLIEYDKLGHNISPAMINEAKIWFKRFML